MNGPFCENKILKPIRLIYPEPSLKTHGIKLSFQKFDYYNAPSKD